jgi:hypothetical protein
LTPHAPHARHRPRQVSSSRRLRASAADPSRKDAAKPGSADPAGAGVGNGSVEDFLGEIAAHKLNPVVRRRGDPSLISGSSNDVVIAGPVGASAKASMAVEWRGFSGEEDAVGSASGDGEGSPGWRLKLGMAEREEAERMLAAAAAAVARDLPPQRSVTADGRRRGSAMDPDRPPHETPGLAAIPRSPTGSDDPVAWDPHRAGAPETDESVGLRGSAGTGSSRPSRPSLIWRPSAAPVNDLLSE